MSIALLIPCYNASKYLPSLAEQLANLQSPFDEVILANDCSTDDTATIARKLGLSLIDLEINRGPGAARNHLAKACSSDWIHFLDSDDLIDPNFAGEVAKQIREDVDVILCSGDFIDESSGSLLQRWQFDQHYYSANPVNAAFKSPVPSFCSTIRRRSFLEIGGFNEKRRCWEDGDLHLRLAVAGAKFGVTNRVLSISPRHDRGASGNHLYCHQCRLAFLEDYIRNGFPIDKSLLYDAVVSLGYLFLAEGQGRLAYRSYSLIEKIGSFRPSSNNFLFQMLLRCLPISLGHLASAAVKLTASRLARRRAY